MPLEHEPAYPNRDEVELPLLRALIELGGSAKFSVRGKQIEDMLAEELKLSKEQREYANLRYRSQGHRKWRNEIQFVKDQLRLKGEIDASRYNYWVITPTGRRRVEILDSL